MRDGHVLGLGHADDSRGRGALQPDGVSQRLDLAARHGARRRSASRATASRTTWCASPKDCSAAAQQFELRRLPELFCGFTRHARRGADALSDGLLAAGLGGGRRRCSLVQALLGLDIDGRRRRVTLRQPRLPSTLEWLRFTRITVRDAELDLLCERRGDDVGISVIRKTGDVKLATER